MKRKVYNSPEVEVIAIRSTREMMLFEGASQMPGDNFKGAPKRSEPEVF